MNEYKVWALQGSNPSISSKSNKPNKQRFVFFIYIYASVQVARLEADALNGYLVD